MKRFLIIAILALTATSLRAQDDTALQFKDKRVQERAIKAGDANRDGILTKAEADSIKILNMMAYRIDMFQVSSYEDFVNFPNLEKVHLGYSDLETVDLSRNPKLEEIVIGDSSLKTLILAFGCNPKIIFPTLMEQLVIKRVACPGYIPW
ncbi:MAG: hypothetical protein IJR01_01890 [Bacteroidales bacterium]|nr:hypothetical protein [Bacteroidales bacterium]MBR0297708.1 hypothetical protein [Bacteroidales bacterium]